MINLTRNNLISFGARITTQECVTITQSLIGTAKEGQEAGYFEENRDNDTFSIIVTGKDLEDAKTRKQEGLIVVKPFDIKA